MFDIFEFFKGRNLTTRLILLACTGGLVAIGIMMIYASGNPINSEMRQFAGYSSLWKKQCLFAAIGFLGLIIINSFSYKKLGSMSFILYWATIVLLFWLVLDKFIDMPLVTAKHGSRCWIVIGSMQFQPSEFFKFAYIVALAWHLRYRSNYRNFTSLIPPFVLTLFPMMLIFLEPDLGTVMLMMPVLLSMLFIAGAKVKHLLAIILLAAIAFPVLWLGMHDYQRMRVSSVLLQNKIDGSPSWLRTKVEKHPALASLLGVNSERLRNWDIGAGYQLMRSKLAIASGGFAGQGYRTGPFIKYKFLPDRHNDFIFALVCHQWGFAGAVLLLCLYAMLIACSIDIAASSFDTFGSYIAAGFAVLFSIQILINISMTIGLIPITGLTLPFISYGGSSIMTNIMSVGLINSIGRSR